MLAGRLMFQEEMRKVVTLPSKEVMQAQLLGIMASLPSKLLAVMNAVPSEFVGVLAAAPRDLLGVLKAIEQKGTPTS